MRPYDGTSLTVPTALSTDDPASAAATLRSYFCNRLTGRYPSASSLGAAFDSWDSLGTRAADTNVFTADDLIAHSFVSQEPLGSQAARILLHDRAGEFAGMLSAVGPDRDLAGEPGPLGSGWPAWQLEIELRTLPGIGRTAASTLIARKRPRLYPMWDAKIADVLGTRTAHIVRIHLALRTDPTLRSRLITAREAARLPDHISELRVLEVIARGEHTARRPLTHSGPSGI